MDAEQQPVGGIDRQVGSVSRRGCSSRSFLRGALRGVDPLLARLAALTAFAALAALLLAGCASTPPVPAQRLGAAQALAAGHGWRLRPIAAGAFRLAAWLPPAFAQSGRLTVYIEGDGLAWLGASRPAPDPTPLDPLALRLALAQPDGDVAYLARPCQYVGAIGAAAVAFLGADVGGDVGGDLSGDLGGGRAGGTADAACRPDAWTQARFGEAAVAASDRALDQVKALAGARRLTLVGYSGGAAIAALVAARRSDVDRLVSVAGNLDHAAWTRLHALTPLAGSLNAADAAPALGGVAQWHYVGRRDAVVPPAIAESFAARFPAGRRPRIVAVDGFDHRCCWAEQWPALWRDTGFAAP